MLIWLCKWILVPTLWSMDQYLGNERRSNRDVLQFSTSDIDTLHLYLTTLPTCIGKIGKFQSLLGMSSPHVLATFCSSVSEPKNGSKSSTIHHKTISPKVFDTTPSAFPQKLRPEPKPCQTGLQLLRPTSGPSSSMRWRWPGTDLPKVQDDSCIGCLET